MPKPTDRRSSRLRSTAALPAAHAPEAEEERSSMLFWLKAGVGVCLLPLCYLITQTFLGAFGQTSAGQSLISSAALWFFALGGVLWLIAFLGLPRPLYLYVLGHELTHALFVLLCGGRITDFKVRPEGGHIITNKNNILISLSPYFVPFYAVLVVALIGLIGIFADLSAYYPNSLFWGQVGFSWSWVFYAAIGASWCFHLTFTGWMITKSQPDLKQNGTFFSLTVIYLMNLLILSAFLITVSRQITLHGFCSQWLENARALLH